MKKHLLILLTILLTSGLSFGQFTQAGDNTGISSDCDLITEAGKYTWAVWGPDGGGGPDETAVDVMDLGWGTNSGAIYLFLELTTPLDLSATANQKIKVSLKSTVEAAGTTPLPLTYILRLEDASNASLLDATNTFAVTGTTTDFEIDFSGTNTAALTAVKKIIFYYGSPQASAHLFVSNLSVGSLVVAGTKDASSLVASSNLYPNPATGTANVELELKSSANVKIVLNDMYGKEVKVITERSSNSISESFDVSGLNKGIYMVSYLVDGAPAKSEKLVIK